MDYTTPQQLYEVIICSVGKKGNGDRITKQKPKLSSEISLIVHFTHIRCHCVTSFYTLFPD